MFFRDKELRLCLGKHLRKEPSQVLPGSHIVAAGEGHSVWMISKWENTWGGQQKSRTQLIVLVRTLQGIKMNKINLFCGFVSQKSSIIYVSVWLKAVYQKHILNSLRCRWPEEPTQTPRWENETQVEATRCAGYKQLQWGEWGRKGSSSSLLP